MHQRALRASSSGMLALRALAAGPVSGVALLAPPAAERTRRKRWLVPAIGAAIAGLAALSLGLYLSHPEPLYLSTYRFSPVATEAETEGHGSWSPDGKSIAYLKTIEGRPQVMVRNLASPWPTQLTRVAAGVTPLTQFFSRDGEYVYFIAGGAFGGNLWSVAVVGGEPRQV